MRTYKLFTIFCFIRYIIFINMVYNIYKYGISSDITPIGNHGDYKYNDMDKRPLDDGRALDRIHSSSASQEALLGTITYINVHTT